MKQMNPEGVDFGIMFFSHHGYSIDYKLVEIFDRLSGGDIVRIDMYDLNNKEIIESLIQASRRRTEIFIFLL